MNARTKKECHASSPPYYYFPPLPLLFQQNAATATQRAYHIACAKKKVSNNI